MPRTYIETSVISYLTARRSGDPGAAQRRIDLLADMPLLIVDDRVGALAEQILADGAVPAGSITDAAHIAVATIHSMQFLATWNFKHMANAFAIDRLRTSCEAAGYKMPTICTPEQFAETGAGDPAEPFTDA